MSTSEDRPLPWRKRFAMRLAEVGLVLAALVVITLRSMTIPCFTAPLLILALLVIWRVTRGTQSPRRRYLTSLVLVTVVCLATTGYAFYATSSRRLFRTYVAGPMPSSVRVLDSAYQGGLQGMDFAVFLHFQGNPDDIDAVLQARPYETSEDRDGFHPTPDWWMPESLENSSLYYWQEPNRAQSPSRAAWLWVDEDHDEAYFTYWTF